jgi:hypothetical protein
MPTLAVIRKKIELLLSKYSIDDFYFNPELKLTEDSLLELMEIQDIKDLKSKVNEFFIESNFETKKNYLNTLLEEFESKISLIEKELSEYIEKITLQNTFLSETEIEFENIPKEIFENEEEIKTLTLELETITPLENNPNYAIQIKKCKESVNRLNEEIKFKISKKDELVKQKNDLLIEINKTEDVSKSKDKVLEDLRSNYNKTLQDLEDIENKPKTDFDISFENLKYIYFAVYGRKIEIISEDFRSEDFQYFQRRLEYSQQKLETFLRFKLENIEYIESNENFEESNYWSYNYLVSEPMSYAEKLNYWKCLETCFIPEKWKTVLKSILSNSIPSFSGIVEAEPFCIEVFPEKNIDSVDFRDLSFLLALKNGLRQNSYIKNSNNLILLELFGGVSASITFREKTEYVKTKTTIETAIFPIIKDKEKYLENKDRQLIEQILYTQNGYANSTINILLPIGYYILTQEYVVEIYFHTTPILFNSNAVAILAPNISVIAKSHDEDIRQEKREEEKRKRKEDDDYYYHLYNDDDD